MYVVPVKSKVEISQNFVAFSEYMNFTKLDYSMVPNNSAARLLIFEIFSLPTRLIWTYTQNSSIQNNIGVISSKFINKFV